MKIENVNLIEVFENDKTIQFRKNDIVKITLNCGINPIFVGRIIFIDKNSVEIDASKEYKRDIRNIEYEKIEKIEKIKEGVV